MATLLLALTSLAAGGCGGSEDDDATVSAGGSSTSLTGGTAGAAAGGAGGSAAGSAGTERGGAGVGGGASGNGGDSAGAGIGGTSAAGAGAGSGSGGSAGAGGAAAGSAGTAGESSGGNASGAGGTGQGGQAGASGGASAGGAGGSPDYQPCPASPCVVLPLGDSITYGYGTTTSSGADEASPGGYRTRLFAAAVADDKTLTFVGNSADGPTTVSGKPFPRQHEGHASYTIDGSKGITQFIDSGVVSKFKPNIVLLMIGTNDMSQNLDLANAPNRLGKLMDKIYADAPTALIVVAKITPSQKDPANGYTKTYNAALPAVVQARVSQGKHAVLVDMNTPFAANANWKKELMRDSVHPNNAGYDILSKTWYAAIRAYLR